MCYERVNLMTTVLGLVTCFNRKDKTVNAIEGLIRKNTNIQFEFIVVDDASTDGTKIALEKFPQVKVLEGNGNLYYTGGMRFAIEEALTQEKQYDFCLLFNDDVKFFDGVIDEMTACEKGIIWVGPTCNEVGELTYGGIIKTSNIRPSFRIVKAESSNGELCDTFNANCVLIPWEIFSVMGNMDSMYSHSLGDFDYGFLARRMGFEIRVISEYIGICCDNPTAGGWRDTSLRRYERLKKKESPKGLPRKEWFYYLKKNYSIVTAVIYSVIPYVRILLKK